MLCRISAHSVIRHNYTALDNYVKRIVRRSGRRYPQFYYTAFFARNLLFGTVYKSGISTVIDKRIEPESVSRLSYFARYVDRKRFPRGKIYSCKVISAYSRVYVYSHLYPFDVLEFRSIGGSRITAYYAYAVSETRYYIVFYSEIVFNRRTSRAEQYERSKNENSQQRQQNFFSHFLSCKLPERVDYIISLLQT